MGWLVVLWFVASASAGSAVGIWGGRCRVVAAGHTVPLLPKNTARR